MPASLHIQKNACNTGVASHNNRVKKVDPSGKVLYKSYSENVNEARSNKNLYLDLEKGTFSNEPQKLASTVLKDRLVKFDTYRKENKLKGRRKDAVRDISMILSASHKEIENLKIEGKKDKWIQANYEFVVKNFKAENIIEFTIHEDEETTHIHATVIPFYENEKKEIGLSAKKYIDGKKDLSRLQREYSDKMAPFGIEKSIKGSKKNHTTTREYNTILKKEHKYLLEESQSLYNYRDNAKDKYLKIANMTIQEMENQIKILKNQKEKIIKKVEPRKRGPKR